MGRYKKGWFYAVSVGRKPGIYRTWSETETQVLFISSNLHRSFPTFLGAEKFLQRNGTRVEKCGREGIITGKSDGKCWYCGIHLTDDLEDFGLGELEHQLPKAGGGGSTLDNLVLSCRACNQQKSDSTVEGFRSKIIWPEGSDRLFFGEKLKWMRKSTGEP
ncbi:ribonuclease H1 domain-containing protein [Deinococcus roseus]|uniref:HNH endonuclease n=1 Tax=Deinococcus roseus TaxID=392414 RepID=A0ABQ2D3H7_9DEIO|nr:viroplasmin family protein [Deinococcus roseus]GGJ43176.1 hypothetical protein GCM10008938_31800 [Deinococcus roseus]